MAFVKATKQEAKLKMAIEGPSGSGKTMTALLIGQALCSGSGKLALVDTENSSAAKYCDLIPFETDVIRDDFHPKFFIRAIKDAATAGFEVLILDSLSHAWFGPGGILELTDRSTSSSGNKFAGWKTTTPIQTELSQAIIQADIHIISTMRTRTEWVIEEDSKGRKVPRKVGLKVVQRDDLEYEFDVAARLDDSHEMTFVKTRCPELDGKRFTKPGADVAEILRRWLSGAPRVPPPPPTERIFEIERLKVFAREHHGIKNRAQWDAFVGTRSEEEAYGQLRLEMPAEEPVA